MDALYDHGRRKFPQAGLLASSQGRGWANVAAELRHHPKGQIPDICSQQTEITLALTGTQVGRVYRSGNGRLQDCRARSGTLWLCPPGVHEQEIVLTEDIPQVFHLYMPQGLTGDEAASEDCVLTRLAYAADVNDDFIRQICLRIIEELQTESAGGALLVEQLALVLGTHLRMRYCDGQTKRQLQERQPHMLDERRLKRVIDYVESHLFEDLSVTELAEVACLSRSHFARAFRGALGQSPSDYVGDRRLENAKQMLQDKSLSLTEIAATCCFSSQAAFTRAFKKKTGQSPGAFRRQ